MGKQRSIMFLWLTAFWLAAGCATTGSADWKHSEECFPRLTAGAYDKIIRDSKAILRNNRWNADAHACLAMAYYLKSNTEFALKSLKGAEDTIPKEAIDAIHDKIWMHLPELLAEKEYRDFHAITGGDCILRNVTALDGNGFLILGYFYNPEVQKRIRHIRGNKCDANMDTCSEIDKVCPACTLEESEAVITIRDYKISEVQKLIDNRPIERNIRYIEKILELELNRITR
ncbi:MAG: hypothetical protein AB1553_13635 [Nitrospirota bacterium]